MLHFVFQMFPCFCPVGLLYGAAIGDALGLATMNMTRDECNFYYDAETLNYSDIISDKHRLHWDKGDWTTAFDQMVSMPRLNVIYIPGVSRKVWCSKLTIS